MSLLTDLLFNAGTGGLFGLVGSVATSWMRLKEKSVDNAHQLALADKAAASAEAVAAWGAFGASHTAAAAELTEKCSPWAANVRAVTRPALTLLLVLAATIAALFFAPPDVKGQAIAGIITLASTAVAWWFGSRQTISMQAPPRATPAPSTLPR